jgi:DNA-binding LacI/PurR family transcriptional regulator
VAVTMDDVAARAGVSRAAVSLALRNSPKVSAARREQILQVAAELGYRPNINASRLARARTGTIGVVFSDLHNALYAEMLDGLAGALGDGPEQLLLASGFHDPDRERAAVEGFLSHRVDGLALLGSQLPTWEIQQLASEIPTVIAGRRVDGVDWVTVDDAAGAALATEHLITLGHRRIAHIDGGTGAGAVLRREQFQTTMRKHHLARQAIIANGDYTERTGHAAALKLMTARRPPSAIFAANDSSALGVLAAARSGGLVVPTSISVIGFDNTTIAQSEFIGLSTIDYPRQEMGEQVLTLLKDRITDPSRPSSKVTLAPELIPRMTTAPYPDSLGKRAEQTTTAVVQADTGE